MHWSLSLLLLAFMLTGLSSLSSCLHARSEPCAWALAQVSQSSSEEALADRALDGEAVKLLQIHDHAVNEWESKNNQQVDNQIAVVEQKSVKSCPLCCAVS